MYQRKTGGKFVDVIDEKGNNIFTMKEEINGESLTVGIAGALQNESVYEFEDEIMALLSVLKNSQNRKSVGCRYLDFDLSRVSYISSAALKSFLKFQNTVDGIENFELKIANSSEPVMRKFIDTGYVDIITICDNDESAGD